MTILIADDDIVSRKILASLLQKKGHDVLIAEDGNETWSIMQRSDAPRLIILDWLMPGMDGEEICRLIRGIDRDIPVYIIMLTIKGSKEDVVRGLEAGANDYLSKPYDSGELYARINVGRKVLALESALVDKIANLKLNETKIETMLAEKNLMLFEVHHRIKNNMNTIINLLTLQAETASGKDTEEALLNATSRMKSMGILYDKLYRSENLAAMSVNSYIPSLIDEIIAVFPDRYKIQVDLDIEDFEIDVQRMSGLGIIINELVFNSMKYAFVGRDSGVISVTIERNGDHATCIFEDSGVGMPESVNTENPETFGLKLVLGMAAQIGGRIYRESCAGTRFVLDFKLND